MKNLYVTASSKYVKSLMKTLHKENINVDSYDALSYDSWKLLRKALNICTNTDTECLNKYMRNIDNFEGAVDNISMSRGNAVRSVYVNEIRNEKMHTAVKVY